MYTYKVLEVSKVVDGDTLDLIVDLGFSLRLKERIRLAGLDAPEILSKDPIERRLGFAVKEYVEDWLRANTGNLMVRTVKGDKYGHMLGYVSSSSSELNKDLLDLRYVWPYDGGTKSKDMEKLSGWASLQQESAWSTNPDM